MSEIIAVTNDGNYEIIIEDGSLDSLGQLSSTLVSGKRAFIVTDKNVAEYYLLRCINSLESEGFTVSFKVVPPGEETKCTKYLLELYTAFNYFGLTRTDLIVALGGGVVGDLTGFAASSYVRGVPLIQVPTTLLAQVDSAIGGKTAINMPFGKNLVGAFYQPKAVLSDPLVLSTLSQSTFNDGMAEVIKCGCIKDIELFSSIELGGTNLQWVIEKCARIKTAVVEADERDTGERMLLNFGHTVGHAIEKVANYEKYTHGQAISIGMVVAAKLGENLGITKSGTAYRIESILEKFDLPVKCDLNNDEILAAMISDKKTLSDTIYFVLLKEIGESVLYPIKYKLLKNILRTFID